MKILLPSFFIVILVCSSFLPYISAFDIPPTPAFNKGVTGNGTVQAKNYSTPIHFLGIGNLTITSNNHTKTIIFNATAFNGKNGKNGTNGTNGINGTNGAGVTYDSMTNIGSGQASIYSGNNTITNFQFKTLSATGASSLTNASSLVTIYTHTYQNNTGTNLGTHGAGPYVSTTSAGVLQFLSLMSGNSICTTSSNSTNQIFTCTFSDPAPKVSINGNNRTTFIGVIANQTFPAPKVSINGINASQFTIDNVTINTVTGQKFTIYNDTINGITGHSFTIRNVTGTNLGTSGTSIYTSTSNNALQFLKLISANSNCSFGSNSTNVILTCSNTGVTSISVIGSGSANQATGAVIITTKTYQNNTGTNLTPGNALYTSTTAAGVLQFRGITCGAGMTCSTNATTFRINSTATGTVTSVTGTGNNITSTGGQTPQINIGSNVVTLAQNQTINSVKTFKPQSSNSPITIYQNSAGIQVATITKNGFWNGPVNIAESPDYVIYKNSTDNLVYELAGKNGTVLKKNALGDVVLQNAINNLNATGQSTGKGGWIDVDCGTYNMTAEVEAPRSGNMTLTGHNAFCTIFKMQAGKNLNFMGYHGRNSATSFGNHFAHFQVLGNNGAGSVNNTGFFFNATGTAPLGGFSGLSDSTWDDIYIWNFKQSDFFFNDKQCYNNIIENSIIEHAGNAGLQINGSGNQKCNDMRVINNKFILNEGSGINETGGGGQYTGNFFYSNNKYGFIANALYGGATYSTYNTVTGNFFENNGLGTTNTYDDIKDAGLGDTYTGNTFYGSENGLNKVRYLIDFATFTSNNIATGNNCVGNNIGTANFFNGVTSSTNYIGMNNGCGVWNGFSDIHDATKAVRFYGMSNIPTKHTLNVTISNTNGTMALIFGSNSTSNSTAQTFTNQLSGGFVMQNSPVFIKTNQTGNIFVSSNIGVSDNTVSGGCDVKMQYGLMPAPKTGAAITGTTIGTNMTFDSAVANDKGELSFQFPVSRLTKNLQYWIEPAVVTTGAGGTCTIRAEMEYVTER